MSQNANKPLSKNKTWQAIGAYAEAKDEIARLTAENERLRKAGDALAILQCAESDEQHKRRCLFNWLAAKEGSDAK